MSPSLETAESQWLSQLTAMRNAIAELKLDDQPNGQAQAYGQDIVVNDEDLTGGSGSDDLWNVFSDEEDDEYSSDMLDGVDDYSPDLNVETGPYGNEWLKSKCFAIANTKVGLNPEELEQQLSAMLASDMKDDELQIALADIIGYDDLDFVIELISHGKEIIAPKDQGTSTSNGVFGHLQTRQQREQALQRQDQMHKTASLAAAHSRDGPHYPHVYKISHSAGNTLSAGGRKYGLPEGSKRTEHENMRSIPYQLQR